MEKHKFESSHGDWCCKLCEHDINHPIHAAQPKQPATEPERVSDADDRWRLLTVEEREQRWPKVIAELRTLRAQLAEKEAADRTSCRNALISLAGVHVGTPEETYGINTAWAISDLCRAVAEKEASIEKARRDALEEARLAYESHHHKAHYEDNKLTDSCEVCGEDFRDQVHLRSGETTHGRIRALAAQKKEG